MSPRELRPTWSYLLTCACFFSAAIPIVGGLEWATGFDPRWGSKGDALFAVWLFLGIAWVHRDVEQ